ncbi:MAG: nitronate monooxygenase [Vicinamibacterales bacterium]
MRADARAWHGCVSWGGALSATIPTRLTEALGCRHPIISAGMGGPARSELAAAVSEAGGFGLLGMVGESPELIAREIADVRRRTARPFGVNLVPFATAPALLAGQLAACFDARVSTMCFFWDVHPAIVEQAKNAGCLVLYQVGSLEDAVLAQAAGADVVIVQGVEAGGHVRGRLPLSVLLPQVVDTLAVPIVASGGIADGRGLAAALESGAHGVQCGTIFLASPESFAHDYHKQRIVAAGPGDTVHTDLFAIGWPPHAPVRVLKNSVTAAAGDTLWGNHPDQLPRDVIGDDEGRPVYRCGTDSPLRSTTGDFEQMCLYAGNSSAHVTGIHPAAAIIDAMMRDATAAVRGADARAARL